MWLTVFLLLLLGFSTFLPFNQYMSVYLLVFILLGFAWVLCALNFFHQVWGVLFQMLYPLFLLSIPLFLYWCDWSCPTQIWRLNSFIDLHLDYRVFNFRILIREFSPLVPLFFKHYFFFFWDRILLCRPGCGTSASASFMLGLKVREHVQRGADVKQWSQLLVSFVCPLYELKSLSREAGWRGLLPLVMPTRKKVP